MNYKISLSGHLPKYEEISIRDERYINMKITPEDSISIQWKF